MVSHFLLHPDQHFETECILRHYSRDAKTLQRIRIRMCQNNFESRIRIRTKVTAGAVKSQTGAMDGLRG
jgi:hypothetical protein